LIVAGTARGAKTQTESRALKMALIIFNILTGLVSMALLWSPLWKYGIFVVVCNICVVGAVGISSHWARRGAMLIALVTLLYLVDPIANNSLLSFAGVHSTIHSDNIPDGGAHPGESVDVPFYSSGIQLAARINAAQFVQGKRDAFCTAFYDFFNRDAGLHDERHQNPHSLHWGLCRKGWRNAITVAAGLLTTLQIAFAVIAFALLAKQSQSQHSNEAQGAKVVPQHGP